MNSKLEPGRLQQDLVPADSGSTGMKENVEKEALVPAEVAALEAELERANQCEAAAAIYDDDTDLAYWRQHKAVLRRRIEWERGKAATGGNVRMSDAPQKPSDSPSACEAHSTPCAGSGNPGITAARESQNKPGGERAEFPKPTN